MGVAFILGLQGDDPKYTLALACAKHYAVHSGPEALRHVIDIDPSERDLYETYLPHFEAAVREGHVGAIMSAYNAVYGEPVPASNLLLTDILRNRWGFDGQVVSDCDAVGDIWRNHHAVRTAAEAAALAVKAGNDLCCGQTYNSLLAAVRSNLVTVAEIDTALGRILESRFKLGLVRPDQPESLPADLDQPTDTPDHRQLALQLARESLVLLKNDGVLPLDRSKVKRIAVFGENATDQRMLYGNYNGTPTSCRDHSGRHPRSWPDQTLKSLMPKAVRWSSGPVAAAVAVAVLAGALAASRRLPRARRRNCWPRRFSNAANADILIYVGGINSQLEGEEGNARGAGGIEGFSNGDRTRIELPQVQEDFIHALYATGKPVIMINCSGSPMAMPWEAEHLPAILQAWYPGEEGGRAVGEVLFGDVNPSGRLPLTFYRSTTDLPVFTNYSMANRTYRYFTASRFRFWSRLELHQIRFPERHLESKKVPADGMVEGVVHGEEHRRAGW